MPTLVPFGDTWAPAHAHPGQYLRGRYGPKYLRHAQSWQFVNMANAFDRSSSQHVSTIFPYTNLRIFSTKYYLIFVLIFSNAQNWEESAFLYQKWICILFQLRNIGEKIRRFLLRKSVKTCRELDSSYVKQSGSWTKCDRNSNQACLENYPSDGNQQWLPHRYPWIFHCCT
jgi:hypothetical protein